MKNDCGEDIVEDEEEVHLADVVGDGGGGEVVDRQVSLAVPVKNCFRRNRPQRHISNSPDQP